MAKKLNKAGTDAIRDRLIEAQGGRCALCEKPFFQISGTPCVDHDHTTGLIRGVLCKNCNGMEGKILNRANRASRSQPPEVWLQGLIDYWKFHKEHPSGLIYYQHKTADEKRVAHNAKQRKRRKKLKPNR